MAGLLVLAPEVSNAGRQDVAMLAASGGGARGVRSVQSGHDEEPSGRPVSPRRL